MKRVKLFCWWTDSGSITDRFKRQFIGSRYANDNIEFVIDDSYEYAVVFGNTKETILTDKEHTIFFFQEPHWSQNWDREAYKKSSRVFCSSKKLCGEHPEFIESPSFMFYGGHGDLHPDPIWDWSVDSLLYTNSEKTKLLSIIQRKQVFQIGENIIYQDRCNLAEALNASDINIDIYGGGYWEKDGKKIKGEIWNKKIGLSEYMFSIAIENTIHPNYVTEKFFDCILTNTVPVYYGCYNITDFIPSDCFIQLPDITNHEACFETIRKNCTVENYNKMINNIAKLKADYFTNTNYNIWAKIQKEILV